MQKIKSAKNKFQRKIEEISHGKVDNNIVRHLRLNNVRSQQ